MLNRVCYFVLLTRWGRLETRPVVALKSSPLRTLRFYFTFFLCSHEAPSVSPSPFFVCFPHRPVRRNLPSVCAQPCNASLGSGWCLPWRGRWREGGWGREGRRGRQRGKGCQVLCNILNLSYLVQWLRFQCDISWLIVTTPGLSWT